MIRTINLGIAFMLELAVLFAVGHWGFSLTGGLPVRLLAGLGGAALMAALWGVFAAPKATVPLHGVADVAFRIGWFGVGALAFWSAGPPTAGVALALLYVVNALLLRGRRPDPRSAPRGR
jgi:hypothetical protein